MASHSNGISALQLQKQLGLGSYRTAWLMCAKLRRAMVDPQRQKLSGTVEVDKASIPFRTKNEPVSGGQGRSKIGKIVFIVAVESVEFLTKDNLVRSRPGRIRIEPLRDYTREQIQAFIRRNIEPGSVLLTDGNQSYRGMSDYRHTDFVVKSMAAHVVLPWSHRVISLLKRLGLGTYHGLRQRYIQRYLDEFVWRFNRRQSRPATFHKILGLAIQSPPSPFGAIMADPSDDPDRLTKP